jgi:hypothetical protein
MDLSQLVELKAKAQRRDRPREKPDGRWLGDFLDQDTLSGLLAAEERLLNACASGKRCNADTAELEPAQASQRNRIAREVRPRFLRFLALAGDENAPVHEAGVELWDAYIDGAIDLRGAKCVGRLALCRCHIRGALRIEDASLGILNLQGSRVKGILANRAQIAGSVFLRDGFVTEGPINLFGSKIGGNLQCDGAEIRRMKEQDALICSFAKIGGNILLSKGFRTDGCIRFDGAKVAGKLDCTSGHFTNPQGTTLDCNGATVSGNVCLNDATTIGRVSLASTQVGGDLDCTKGYFTNPQGTALDCSGATVSGNVYLNDATVGLVSLANVRLSGDLHCVGTTMMGSNGTALVGDSATIRGNVFLTESLGGIRGFVATGGVEFYGANIERDLVCSGGQFTNAMGVALKLVAATIKGTVHLNQAWWDDVNKFGLRFVAEGTVSLHGAAVGRDLDCSGGRFMNANGAALVLDAARIEGCARLSQASIQASNEILAAECFEAEGTVSLNATSIGSHLVCNGGRFKAPDQKPAKPAIEGDALVVNGCVILRGPTRQELGNNVHLKKFKSNGEIRLVGAQIGMQLDCTNGEFVNKKQRKKNKDVAGYALNLEIADIRGELLLGPMGQTDADVAEPATIEGSVNLSNTTTRKLVDKDFITDDGPVPAYFPATVMSLQKQRLICEMSLDGFTYDRLDENSCLTAKGRKSWLKRQPEEHLWDNFRHQPFDHLVKVLHAMGHDDEARAIAVFKQQQLTNRIAPSRSAPSSIGIFGVLAVVILLFISQPWLAILAVAGLLLFPKTLTFLWRAMLGRLLGYGYRPAWALVLALVVAMPSGWFYKQAQEQGALSYHKAEKDTASSAAADHPFHPYIYSLDVMLPVVKLGEAEAWKPEPRRFILYLPVGLGKVSVGENCTQYIVWMEMVFGWLAGGILVALAAGLIKKV